jgi:hypothetical protein
MEIPVSAARLTDSVRRSSASVPSATVQRGRRNTRAQALQHGVAAKHHLGVVGALCWRRCCWVLAARFAALAAGWFGRWCAAAWRRDLRDRGGGTPPDPTWGPFLVPALRTAPLRWELPAIYFRVLVQQRPLRSVGGVGDLDARFLEPVPDRVGLGPVPALASVLATLNLRMYQHIDGGQCGRSLVAGLPPLVERVAAEDVPSSPDR